MTIDKQEFRKKALKRTNQGRNFILENEEVIRDCLDRYISIPSIYQTFEELGFPPPMTLRSFYRNINKYILNESDKNDIEKNKINKVKPDDLKADKDKIYQSQKKEEEPSNKEDDISEGPHADFIKMMRERRKKKDSIVNHNPIVKR